MDGTINIENFYKELEKLFVKKDFSVTMEYLDDSLKKATEFDDRFAMIAISNELGGLCRVTGQTDRAKELYEKVFSLLEDVNLNESIEYATALINLGDVYIMTRENRAALACLSEAEKLLIKCGAGEEYQMAALCNNVSMIYRHTGEYSKAESALEKSFKIIERMPQYKIELGTNYVNLGELQIKLGKIEEAEGSFRKAKAIYEKVSGTKDVHYSSAISGLAEVMFHKEMYSEALSMYKEALDLIVRDFGKTPAYELITKNIKEIEKMQALEN